MLKEIVTAKTRRLSARWTVNVTDDIETLIETLEELQRQTQEMEAYELAVKAGWYPVDTNTPKPWPRDKVKAWMATECKGGYSFGTHHCAFELETDASNFIMSWM